MALKRLNLTRGNSDNYGITFRHKDNTPFCIKDWKVYFTLKTNVDLSDAEASLQIMVGTFGDTTSGTSDSANIPILPSDTINLEPREYDFDVAVITDSNDKYTVIKGKFDLEYEVTRT